MIATLCTLQVIAMMTLYRIVRFEMMTALHVCHGPWIVHTHSHTCAAGVEDGQRHKQDKNNSKNI